MAQMMARNQWMKKEKTSELPTSLQLFQVYNHQLKRESKDFYLLHAHNLLHPKDNATSKTVNCMEVDLQSVKFYSHTRISSIHKLILQMIYLQLFHILIMDWEKSRWTSKKD